MQRDKPRSLILATPIQLDGDEARRNDNRALRSLRCRGRGSDRGSRNIGVATWPDPEPNCGDHGYADANVAGGRGSRDAIGISATAVCPGRPLEAAVGMTRRLFDRRIVQTPKEN